MKLAELPLTAVYAIKFTIKTKLFAIMLNIVANVFDFIVVARKFVASLIGLVFAYVI